LTPINTLVEASLAQRFAVVSSLLLAPVGASSQGLVLSPGADATPEAFADFVTEALTEAGVKGWGLTVMRGGRVAAQRSVGTTGAGGSPVTARTVFSAESNAKPVIAWAVMTLVQRGLVQLDSPLEANLKRFRLPPSMFDHREVTVGRVLTHTSGLSWGRLKDFVPGEPLPSIEELFSAEDSLGQRLEVESQPGSRFNYSSGGYALLQLLVEDVSGLPFSVFVREEVLEPLNMGETGFSPGWPSVPSYDGFGRSVRATNDATANDLRTSLADLTAFALAHFDRPARPPGGGVLLPETLSAMLTPSSEARGRRGLGYRLRERADGVVEAGHDGGGSMFRVSPETGDGLVLVSNSDVYMLVPRVECAWERWTDGSDRPCPAPAAHALYGAYQAGGVTAAIERYERIEAEGADGYAVGEAQLALFAHLLVGAGLISDAARVFEQLAGAAVARGEAYLELAEALEVGTRVDPDTLGCYEGEFHGSSADVVTLRLADGELVLDIEGVPWPSSVRPLSRRVFAYDPFGSAGDAPGQLVFELDDAGGPTGLQLSDPDLELDFFARRVAPAEGAESGVSDCARRALHRRTSR
jgi:CubicO group peptidase (beta-lactamase class C family)